jgi:glycosyltransferase involved in cell wall biosynthesis
VKVGYFSPLPPLRTGVADYAEALLDALKQHGRVDVSSTSADVNLYHLGNNQLHRDIYQRAIREPGVVVLHDAVLHHFFLGALDRGEYIEEFVYNYGEWMRERAASLWDRRARSAAEAEYFDYPMLKRIAEVSRAIVVHNSAAADLVRRHVPAARVVEIPHLYSGAPAVDPQEVAHLRQSIGGATVFGVFGHLRESKRVHTVIRAFHDAKLPDARLLLAGECVSSDLERALEPSDGVIRVGYLDERDFWTYAHATDVCINLRYPSAGETSGIAVRFMGIGKPVVMSVGPEIAQIPATACLRVDIGVREQAMLTEYMRWLSALPRDAREIGARGAAHIAAHHGVDAVARQYWEVLRSVA